MVGAGIAGTSCALELHRLGYEVEIFERTAEGKSKRPRQMEGSVYLFHNVPEIETDRYLKRMVLHSPNIEVSLNGKLGFLYEVGGTNGIDEKARRNVEGRLPIHYSTKIVNKAQLQDKFQVIVAADGYRSALAKGAGVLFSNTPTRRGIGVGFTVEGDFDPELIEVWFGNYFSLHGYSYLTPFSKHEASLVSASIGKTVNQATYNLRLRELARLREWKIQEGWVDFESWYDFSSYSKDNLFVIGSAGSFTDPAFGFGLKWAVKSAKLCARAIHENIDYNDLVRKEILRDFESFKIMSKFFKTAKNGDFDMLVKKFKNPLVRKVTESGKSLLQHKRLMHMLFPRIWSTK